MRPEVARAKVPVVIADPIPDTGEVDIPVKEHGTAKASLRDKYSIGPEAYRQIRIVHEGSVITMGGTNDPRTERSRVEQVVLDVLASKEEEF